MPGTYRVRCRKCGSVYPCQGKCQHLDCMYDSGREADYPDWVQISHDPDPTKPMYHALTRRGP